MQLTILLFIGWKSGRHGSSLLRILQGQNQDASKTAGSLEPVSVLIRVVD
jgi:hypothetical protein